MNMAQRKPTFVVDGPRGEALLRELILYIAEECSADKRFGATKLNKILWWSDFLAYAEYGKPITGIEYQRLRNGPAPRRLVPVRDAMVEAGEIVVSEIPAPGGYVNKRIVPMRKADLSQLSPEQVALVDHVIRALRPRTAKEASNLSHGKPWEIASDGESIPYEAVFLSDAPVNRSDVARTRELARQFNWAVA